ncbi:MAG: DUF4352 domain-containing protein [Microthrixaceae bacterium]
MISNRFRYVFGALAITAALFATVGEGSSSGSKDSSSDSEASKDAPESTQAAPIPIGTTVMVAEGWNVVVNSAEMDANATVAAINEYSTPDEGKQYVKVNLSITNNSDQPAAAFTNVSFSLLPLSGIAVDEAFMSDLPDQISSTADMQPGATATGSMLFQVPVDQVAGTVLLAKSTFTLDEAKDQKFMAIQ